jgi:hypothetical protein
MVKSDIHHNAAKSFKGYTIVSCGTLQRELNYLKNTGFLDADRVLYTAPGLHEIQMELEKQLARQIENAKRYSHKIIVVYGERCFLDPRDPYRNTDRLIQEKGPGVARVKAKNCFDLIAGEKEREEISKGMKVYWLTPGWVRYWKIIFKNWDQGLANETFPQNDIAIVLDAIDDFSELSERSPEKILEFSDWMKLGIEPHSVSLDRLKTMLLQQIEQKEC